MLFIRHYTYQFESIDDLLKFDLIKIHFANINKKKKLKTIR